MPIRASEAADDRIARLTEALETIRALPRYTASEVEERSSMHAYLKAEDVDEVLAVLAAIGQDLHDDP